MMKESSQAPAMSDYMLRELGAFQRAERLLDAMAHKEKMSVMKRRLHVPWPAAAAATLLLRRTTAGWVDVQPLDESASSKNARMHLSVVRAYGLDQLIEPTPGAPHMPESTMKGNLSIGLQVCEGDQTKTYRRALGSVTTTVAVGNARSLYEIKEESYVGEDPALLQQRPEEFERRQDEYLAYVAHLEQSIHGGDWTQLHIVTVEGKAVGFSEDLPLA
jgi:hypothetical protein